jgi:hypothetical protein
MNNPRALLVSASKDVAQDIEKVLKDNYCKVDLELIERKIASKQWQQKKKENYNYIVFIDSLQSEYSLFTETYFSDVLEIASNSMAKAVFVLPYYVDKNSASKEIDKSRRILEDKDAFSAVLYTGEIQKEWKLFDISGPFRRLIDDINDGTPIIRVSTDEKFHIPIESGHFAETIVKKLFSISPFGKAEAILSYPVPTKKIKERVEREYSDRKIELTPIVTNYSIMPAEVAIEKDIKNEARYMNRMIDNLLINNRGPKPKTSQLSRNLNKGTVVIKPNKATYKRKKFKIWGGRVKTDKIGIRNRVRKLSINKDSISKTLLKFSVILGLLLMLPIVLLFLSLVLFKSSLYVANEGYLNNAQKSIFLAEKLSSASKKYTSVFSKMPIIKYTHSTLNEIAEYFTREIEIANKSISIKIDLIEGIGEFVSRQPFSIEEFSGHIELEIDYLIQEIDFFRSDTKELSKASDYIARKILGNQAFLIKGNLHNYKEIMDSLPLVLGKSGKTKYLILLQNDSISRASGGLIESVLLVTFEKGKLSNMEVMASKELDRNLAGAVEPPLPLKEYFKEDKWLFKDSNWFSDFRNTAEQVEWFVDKELDEQVDGVVAVNYRFLRRLIELYGQLEVNSEITVNSENILKNLEARGYETYPEVFDTDLIAAELLKGMIEKFPGLKSKDQSNVLNALLIGLKEKDIQIFVHNNKFRSSILDIGWGGSTYVEDCIGNCYEDYVGIIETEHTGSRFVNTNKLATFDVSIEEGLIKRNLTFFIENMGSDQNGNESNYRSYVRVVIPSGSGTGMIKVISKDDEREIRPQVFGIEGNKEVGTFVKVGEGDTLAVVFSWESGVDLDMSVSGEYGLKWIKQPGTEDYPAEIGIFVNEKNLNFELSNLSLTEENRFGYNTSLSRDIISRIFWQK